MRFANRCGRYLDFPGSDLAAASLRSLRRALGTTPYALAALGAFACLVMSTDASALPPQPVQQTSIKGGFVNLPGPPPKRVWRETIKFRNDTGERLPNAIVTSQPYSGEKDFPGQPPRGGKTAVKQEKQVAFEVGEEKEVTFDFDPLAGGKGYDSWYTDFYKDEAMRKKNIGGLWVGAEHYTLLEVPPGPGGSTLTDSFRYPYPDAVERQGLGEVLFNLDVLETDLPPGWTFVGLTDDSFVLTPFNSHSIGAVFIAPATLVPGQVAQVEFNLRIGDQALSNGYLGIRVVPEPRSANLMALGIGATIVSVWLAKARRRSPVQG